MACSTSSSSSPTRNFFINTSFFSSTRRPKTLVISSITDRRVPYNPLVFQAASLLGPPARFEPSKLKVIFLGDDAMTKDCDTIPRKYSLSHCDLTANLTLAISNVINHDQFIGWYKRDDVVAEWKKVNDEMCLHVHCNVSGPHVFLDLVAEFRYYIFKKELPLVLEAILHGDSTFFKEHPELMNAFVRVYFHSSLNKYNRVECWGALRDAGEGKIEDPINSGQKGIHSAGDWGNLRAIFQTLGAFLL